MKDPLASPSTKGYKRNFDDWVTFWADYRTRGDNDPFKEKWARMIVEDIDWLTEEDQDLPVHVIISLPLELVTRYDVGIVENSIEKFLKGYYGVSCKTVNFRLEEFTERQDPLFPPPVEIEDYLTEIVT